MAPEPTNKELLYQIQEQIDERFNRIESMIAGSQGFAYAVAQSERRRDLKQMAEFSRLNAKVTKIGDLAEAIKVMHDGVKAERDAAVAELAALKAADAIDQSAVDTAEANLAIAEAKLEALTAVIANTPSDTGGSTAGNLEPT